MPGRKRAGNCTHSCLLLLPPAPAAGDLHSQAQSLQDPAEAKASFGRWAQGLLLIIAAVALATVVLHSLVVLLWRALPGSSRRPLPPFLSFPGPELLVANCLLLPLATAASVLLFQTGVPGRVAVGALGWVMLLGYLALVTSVALALARSSRPLGLRYIIRGDGLGTSYLAGLLPQATASLLQRLAPGHASGHWDTPPLALQQQLRQVSQGEPSYKPKLLPAGHSCLEVERRNLYSWPYHLVLAPKRLPPAAAVPMLQVARCCAHCRCCLALHPQKLLQPCQMARLQEWWCQMAGSCNWQWLMSFRPASVLCSWTSMARLPASFTPVSGPGLSPFGAC